MTWTESELAYFAGIIDGEGTIGARNRKNQQGKRYIDFYLSVANTDERLVLWIQQRFPASVDFRQQRDSDKHRPLYRWTAGTKVAEDYIRAVLPYLVVKKEQAELYLEIRSTVSKGQRLTEGVKQQREAMVVRLHELNRRGA